MVQEPQTLKALLQLEVTRIEENISLLEQCGNTAILLIQMDIAGHVEALHMLAHAVGRGFLQDHRRVPPLTGALSEKIMKGEPIDKEELARIICELRAFVKQVSQEILTLE
jgi:hypothetical protein